MKPVKIYSKIILIFLILSVLLFNSCATYNKNIVTGMVVGASMGALVGNQFEADNNQEKIRNSIISSIFFALAVGGAMHWHYQSIEKAKVEMSGKFTRYRLCDPEEMNSEVYKKLKLDQDYEGSIYMIGNKQIGKLSISLDDNTKWIYPVFRKRYLLPELSETQVISKRYLWEIIKPGNFVTRSQNPEYFYQEEKVEEKKEQTENEEN